MKLSLLLITFFILFNEAFVAAQSWREITSVEDICKAYPNHMRAMVGEFNLDHLGLEKVKKAMAEDDIEKACNDLLSYYKNSNTAVHLRKAQPEKTTKTVALADTILIDVFVIQNVRGAVPYGDDGHRDWYYKGPNNDREWAWLSNRHSQISQVLSSYFKTGNPKYAVYIDLFLRDFIIKSMPYPGIKSNTSVWRGLEVAARAKVWSHIFYGLLNSEYLSPSTQLLLLSSLPDHAHYSRNFHGGNNWLTMEISALATVATNFPEYIKSNEWLMYSIETMTESMNGQVYADGVQTELSSHYHNVAMSNFELFKAICDNANKTLPDFFNQTIEDMYSYIAHAIRPDGFRILNNDGDRGSDRDIVLKASKKFNNAEWEYIASNGKSGTRPLNGPSFFYPWAGQLISRSGYDADAHWSFFDIGPWGSGHQHNDKLHISISAFGRDLLVDAGRFAYTGEVANKFRRYAKGSQGHNVVLIDGNGQAPGSKVVAQPLDDKHYAITPEFDYAWNSFDKFNNIKDEIKHTRTMMYVRDNFWIVVDNIETDKPRKIETLWHWHPDIKELIKKKNTVTSVNEIGNLRIIPVGKQQWKVELIKGQEDPEIQGWYSPEYNKYAQNLTTVYSTEIHSNSTFVWILMPFESAVKKVKAKVLTKDVNGISIKIKNHNKQQWIATIPFSESSKARLDEE